jgi:hypothetical protein
VTSRGSGRWRRTTGDDGFGRAHAIVEAWFPGEVGAAAIARVLFGDTSPGGKLTTGFVSHPGVLPLTYDHVPMEGLGQRARVAVDLVSAAPRRLVSASRRVQSTVRVTPA